MPDRSVHSVLGLDSDELAACVACGLCLPHCPTYRVTGDEMASPRGRIAAMRAVENETLPAGRDFVDSMESCVQCRGCETACPSGVPFGRLMERTRTALQNGVAGRSGRVPRWLQVGLVVLGHPPLLRVGALGAGLARRAGLRLAGLSGHAPLRRGRLAPVRNRRTPGPWLFTGCVMDQWDRDVHRAVLALAHTAGEPLAVPAPSSTGGCCGALAAHAGLHDLAARQARAVMARYPGADPIVVDSAGCGAGLQAYGDLLGTGEARRFAARAVDASSWLAARLDRLPSPRLPVPSPVAVQDPCHLRHVQRAHLEVRTLLSPYAEIAELDDEGLCCGAGGAYSILQSELAGLARDRKVASIARTKAEIVASANPGCAMHLGGAGVRAVHPAVIVAVAAGLVDRSVLERGEK